MSSLLEGPLLPRGRTTTTTVPVQAKSTTSSDVRKKSSHQDAKTILFGAAKPTKKRVAPTTTTTTKKTKTTEEEDATAQAFSLMTLSRVTPGMKFLASVSRATKDKVVLAICNQLSCVVPQSEVSDEHFEAFQSGK